ncbi:MAG: recombination regulator RecX [Clostridiales Family XIII bacterium]|jgi:regulatory protein|nr:recombination regulator RecX [Clostridiales Family XIII bacterium]
MFEADFDGTPAENTEESIGEDRPKNKNKKPKISAQEKALCLLEKQSRTAYQIRLSLSKAGYDAQEIDEALEFLVDVGYIDDAAYAKRYLEILIEKGRGRRRAADEMRRHGLAAELVRFTIEDGYPAETERENAMIIATKATSEMRDDVPKTQIARRISLKLTGQGYNFDVINSVIDEIIRRRGDRDEAFR